jgi:hypothetical protein
MLADSTLGRLGGDDRFLADPVPRLLLDNGWVIRGVNPAYLRATDRERDDLMGQYIFDAFPDNPDDPAANGVARLGSSLEAAQSTAATDDMFVTKYDVPARDGGFTLKYWSPSNAPIVPRGQRASVGILHSVEDVTRFWADLIRAEPAVTTGLPVPPALARALVRNARAHERAARELDQLRVALTSRIAIEQAKGILMARHECPPEDAFAALRAQARSEQRSLHDVAAEVIRAFRDG